VGDGGFAMTGLDLLTAARTGVPLTVIVLNDGGYGLIREQQLAAFGRTSGVDHPSPDFEGLAGALGAEYTRFDGDRAGLVQALSAQCSLVEVRMGDSWRVTLRGAAMRGRAAVREIPLLARFARLVLGWVRRRRS